MPWSFKIVNQMLHSSHPSPFPWVMGEGGRGGTGGGGGGALFQDVYIEGTYVKSKFWVGIGTLGGDDFFQAGPENSLYKR